MNKAAAAWVASLRTTDLKQAHYNLKEGKDDDMSYCCLGVACEMSGTGIWALGKPFDDVYGYVVLGEAAPFGCLPPAIREEYGLRTEVGEFEVTDEWLAQFRKRYARTAVVFDEYMSERLTNVAALAWLNDWQNKYREFPFTFAMIADIIEAQPPGLFVDYGK